MSQRHPGSRRTKPESAQGPDDVFVARILHLGKWAEANQQIITVGLIVVALLFGGLLYYRSYRRNLIVQAGQQLEAIHQSAAIQDREGARAELVTFLERFGGTPYEAEARLLLGDLYLRDGSSQQAEAVLRPIGGSPREPIEFQAASLLASALEQQERWSDAEDVYLSIANRSELDFQVRDALEAAARLRASQGDAPGAIQLYERILDVLGEDSPERGLYEMRMAEIRAASNA